MQYSPEIRRKENYGPISNQNNTQYLKRKSVQQKQIQDLQQKVDIILIHNQKLIAENQELKRSIMQRCFDRYGKDILMEKDMQIIAIKNELQEKTYGLDRVNDQLTLNKKIFAKELSNLTKVVKQLTNQNQQLHKENQQLRQIQRKTDQKINQAVKKAKLKLFEQFQNKEKNWEEERKRINQSKLQYIGKLEDNFEKQRKQIKKVMEEQFKKQIQKLMGDMNQRGKIQKEKAQAYIRSFRQNKTQIENIESNLLKKEIESLKSSLQSRKNVLLQLSLNKIDEQQKNPWYQQLMNARRQMKNLTQHYLRQSELLKIKMAQQSQLNINQVQKAYKTSIQAVSYRNYELEKTNTDLRVRLEEQIQNKINMKHKFEIQISKLKNLIKKLKIDLNRFDDQYRIQIQNIKTHNSQISSHLVIEIQAKKNKDNFYQEELAKLRIIIDKKDKDIELVEQKCKEKVKYYNQKYENILNKLETKEDQWKLKSQEIQAQIKHKELQYSNNIYLEKQKLMSIIKQHQKEIGEMKDQKNRQIEENKELKGKNVQNIKTINDLKQKIQSCNAHIEALKLQIDMKGVQDPDQQRKRQVWKQFYQDKVSELQEDKLILNEQISKQKENLTSVIIKYNDLESSLKQTMSTIKKKSKIQQKIIQIGNDNNLVKNLMQLFRQ